MQGSPAKGTKRHDDDGRRLKLKEGVVAHQSYFCPREITHNPNHRMRDASHTISVRPVGRGVRGATVLLIPMRYFLVS